jgi:hypothetical protein
MYLQNLFGMKETQTRNLVFREKLRVDVFHVSHHRVQDLHHAPVVIFKVRFVVAAKNAVSRVANAVVLVDRPLHNQVAVRAEVAFAVKVKLDQVVRENPGRKEIVPAVDASRLLWLFLLADVQVMFDEVPHQVEDMQERASAQGAAEFVRHLSGFPLSAGVKKVL